MDLEESPAEATFRLRARSWLSDHAAVAAPAVARRTRITEQDVETARKWQAEKYEAGLAGLTWPARDGGQGMPPIHQTIWYQEAQAFDVPEEPLVAGEMLVGPTLILHGDDPQRVRYLKGILRGDALWCQLFSEPDAGSDLAACRTFAKPVDDGWEITGQKVWTSGAQHADYGLLLCRTDTESPKHHGLSMMILDMRQDKIEVRPIRQINGEEHFNEVFIDGAFVGARDLIGSLGDGWRFAVSTLSHERLGLPLRRRVPLAALARLVESNGELEGQSEGYALELAEYFVRNECLRYINMRLTTEISSDSPPGPWGSISKLVSASLSQSTADFALRILAEGALFEPEGAADASTWQSAWLDAPSRRIAGGTDEIQKNIIGERILGLPRESRPSA